MFNPRYIGGRTANPTIPNFIIVVTWVCCFLMAFDFKGHEAGGWYQISSYLLTMALLGAVALLLAQHNARYPNKRLQLGLLFLWMFLGSTVFVAYAQNVPGSNYQVVVAPYALFIFAYWMASALCRFFGVILVRQMLFPALKTLVGLSMIWTLYYGAQGAGVTVETVRYKVISAVFPFGAAYLISAFVSKSLKRWDKVFAAFLSVILIVGQTRSNIIVVAVALVFVTYGHSENKAAWMKAMARAFVFLSIAAIIGLVFAEGLLSFSSVSGNTGIVELWGNRLLGSAGEHGFDLTTASRLAEYDDQMKRLFSSPINAVLGLGLGAPYTYSGVYADLFASVLGVNAIPENYWNGGHSLWFYTLYANGLLVGGAFLVLVGYTVWLSIRLLKLAGRITARDDRHQVVTLAAGYLCILSTGFAAFPLGSRGVSFLSGILIALIVGHETLLSKFKSRIDDESYR